MKPTNDTHIDVLAVEQQARQLRAEAAASAAKAMVRALRGLFAPRPGQKAHTA